MLTRINFYTKCCIFPRDAVVWAMDFSSLYRNRGVHVWAHASNDLASKRKQGLREAAFALTTFKYEDMKRLEKTSGNKNLTDLGRLIGLININDKSQRQGWIRYQQKQFSVYHVKCKKSSRQLAWGSYSERSRRCPIVGGRRAGCPSPRTPHYPLSAF